MKKLIIILTLVTNISSISLAQNTGKKTATNETQQMIAYEKKPVLGSKTMYTANTGINENALKDFSKFCSKAQNVSWEIMTNGNGYVAFHKTDGNSGRRYYGKKGKLICDIINCTEADLPADVLEQVSNCFQMGYNITGAQKVELLNKKFYFVFIQNKTNFKKLSFCDGEINVVEEYFN